MVALGSDVSFVSTSSATVYASKGAFDKRHRAERLQPSESECCTAPVGRAGTDELGTRLGHVTRG